MTMHRTSLHWKSAKENNHFSGKAILGFKFEPYDVEIFSFLINNNLVKIKNILDCPITIFLPNLDDAEVD